MTIMAATSSREEITLFCLAFGAALEHVFSVRISRSCFVTDLRELIKEKKRPAFDDIPADELCLWRVNISYQNEEAFKCLVLQNDPNRGIRKLYPIDEIGDVFQDVVKGYIQVIVQPPTEARVAQRASITGVFPLPPQPLGPVSDVLLEYALAKFKGKVPRIEEIPAFLDEPLPENLKLPLNNYEFGRYETGTSVKRDRCLRTDLEVLCRLSDVSDGAFFPSLMAAVCYEPRSDGSEQGLVGLYEQCIANILKDLIPDASDVRDSSRGRSTGLQRPDYGFIFNNSCVFRGEEKGRGGQGEPRCELSEKIIWTYDPADYVLETKITLVAICAPKPKRKPEIRDLAEVDLCKRRHRIIHLRRMINLSSIIYLIANSIYPRPTPEIHTENRDDKTVKIGPKLVAKIYLNVKDCRVPPILPPRKQLKKLEKIYTLLESKQVPNVDRKVKITGNQIRLKPLGYAVQPQNEQELLQAIICVLEALEKMHDGRAPIFHRDIRWPNIVRLRDDKSKWMLIDWDDAAWPPTQAATHLRAETHAPEVFTDGHGSEVDIWAVGQLILCSKSEISDCLKELGQWMCRKPPRPTAPEALVKVINYVSW